MKLSKSAYRRSSMNRVSARVRSVQPPNAAIHEAVNATKAAELAPLNYVFGDPLPGRSALDKQRGIRAADILLGLQGRRR